MTMSRDRVEELEKQIADLKKRWPAHSAPAAMMEQLDDLDEELRREKERRHGSVADINMGMQPLRVRTIGIVKNELDEPAPSEQIRSAESRIILDPSLVEGLKGLEPGQQIMVIFYFHRSESYDLLQHPQGDRNQPKRGVFALRSPQRPNPIGVTVVKLVSIEGNVLCVQGLDAIDDTPVLDLKPA
jgi:tRNA-Thr(GGU) m(6)t(6)A37 methyltransferase TsaA